MFCRAIHTGASEANLALWRLRLFFLPDCAREGEEVEGEEVEGEEEEGEEVGVLAGGEEAAGFGWSCLGCAGDEAGVGGVF